MLVGALFDKRPPAALGTKGWRKHKLLGSLEVWIYLFWKKIRENNAVLGCDSLVIRWFDEKKGKMPVAIEENGGQMAKNGGPENSVNSVQKPSKPSKHRVRHDFLLIFGVLTWIFEKSEKLGKIREIRKNWKFWKISKNREIS